MSITFQITMFIEYFWSICLSFWNFFIGQETEKILDEPSRVGLRAASGVISTVSIDPKGRKRCKNVPEPDLVLQPVPLLAWHRELHPPFCQLSRLRPHDQSPGHAAHSAVPAALRVPSPVSRSRRPPQLAADWHGWFLLHTQQPAPSARLLLLAQPAGQQQYRPGCGLPEPAGSRKRSPSGAVRRRAGALGRGILFQPVRVYESGDGDVLLDPRTVRERSDQSAGTARRTVGETV